VIQSELIANTKFNKIQWNMFGSFSFLFFFFPFCRYSCIYWGVKRTTVKFTTFFSQLHCFAVSPFLFVYLFTSLLIGISEKLVFWPLEEMYDCPGLFNCYGRGKPASSSHKFLAPYSNLILKGLYSPCFVIKDKKKSNKQDTKEWENWKTNFWNYSISVAMTETHTWVIIEF
jgi:hypothetical protein